jgi:O-antigen/teichoic acid export membrane protein
MLNTKNNKRLAKNTALLYLRLLLSMFISLYISRIILHTLGVEDFGINNVVSGFVSMLVFFQSSLSNVTQRYLNISLGKNNIKEANHVFDQSLSLYFLISIGLYFIGLIFGLWFLEHKLVIPIARLHAAKYVFHFSLFTAFILINQISFVSAIIAREKMAIYAYLGLFDVITKLIIVYLLKAFSQVDHLILYSGLFCLSSFLIFSCYVFYCLKFLPECRISIYWDKKMIKELLNFISLNLFGCIAWTIGYQGIDIVLNMFFGPIVNAARGIAAQVNNAISGFSNNLFVAGNPQITKFYASGEAQSMLLLVERLSKLSFYFILILALPVLYETKYILTLWLGIVPKYAIEFTRLVLIYSVIGVLSTPWLTVINATGQIKNVNIYGRFITLSTLPLSYIFLKFGYSPIAPLIVLLITQFLYILYVIKEAHRLTKFKLSIYIRFVIIPIVIVSIIINIFLLFSVFIFNPGFFRFILTGLISTTIGISTIYKFGLSSTEQRNILTIIQNKMRPLLSKS